MTTIITGGADPNEMPFSIAVSTGGNPRTVQLSGATTFPLVHKHPHDEDELRVPARLYDQTVRALHNMRIALEAAGGAVTDIVKVVIYTREWTSRTRSTAPTWSSSANIARPGHMSELMRSWAPACSSARNSRHRTLSSACPFRPRREPRRRCLR